MHPDIWLVRMAIGFAFFLAANLLAIVWYDLLALRRGWRTFSRETMILAATYRWYGYAWVAALVFPVGILVGHLFFPQVVLVPGD